MLQVIDIKKTYKTGDLEQTALGGVSLAFRDNEFVAILGPSGSGKTTLLNIIGGLDRYDSGDLVINGISTKDYKDKDWDAYRNNSIGFVFQSYNLIPHQTILSNVELSLTLSGISKAERKERAKAALESVGLGEQIHKKPNQLSGGQMQRVAIARALVNEPDIILADEPTGALDSETSVQIMDLLKEVAGDRLVIMVTHNPELADAYATRIIKLKDGYITDDSYPVDPDELQETTGIRPKHTKLRFKTALGLSLNNLMTKKGRTFLTAFAGAIGIIGIALIMALSNGANEYIAQKENEMMGAYPIQLQKQAFDLSSMMERRDEKLNDLQNSNEHELNQIYTNNIVADSVKTEQTLIKENNLGKFKTYLDDHMNTLDGDISAIEYGYDVIPQSFRMNGNDVLQVSPATISEREKGNNRMMSSIFSAATRSAWSQLVTNQKLRDEQYALLEGNWPTKANEIALIITEHNEISDFTLYTLGVMDINKMNEMVKKIKNDESYEDQTAVFSYKDVLGKTYKVFSSAQLYTKSDDENAWIDKTEDQDYLKSIFENGYDVKITGILQAKENAAIRSGVGYTAALTEQLMETAQNTEIVKDQLANPKVNVLTGKDFEDEADKNASSKITGNSNGNLTLKSGFTLSRTQPLNPQADSLMLSQNEATKNVKTAETEMKTDGEALEISEIEPESEPIEEDGPVPETDTFTVSFVNADDTVILAEQSYKKGEKITNLPTEDPKYPAAEGDTRKYIFCGWQANTDPEGTSIIKTAQLPPVTENIIYKAVYFQYGFPSGINNPVAEQATLMQIAMGSMDQKTMVQYVLKNMSQQELGALALASMDEATLQKLIASQIDTSSLSALAFSGLDASSLAAMYGLPNMDLSADALSVLMAQYSSSTPTTYEEVLSTLGYVSKEEPTSIDIYPVDFEGKDAISALIDAYNEQCEDEADHVTYTDIIGLAADSITSIIDTITALLIGFVAISLVVSSIMIAIITYVSVLERTKEIGVLRAIGASKKDVSKIFNAETFIEGLISGVLGIGVTLLICIPANIFISNHYDVEKLASLPPAAAVGLIVISVVLTLLAGFAPARMAAKKDPVTALRSE